MTGAADPLRSERLCHQCGYSREGIAIDRPCPECGTLSPVALMRFAGRPIRRWWLLPLIVFLACVSIELANIGTSKIIDLLRSLDGRRGPGPFPPLFLICGLPLTPIFFLVSYLLRLGEPELWTMEEDRLAVRGEDGSVKISWRYRDLREIRRDPGSPLGATFELVLRRRQHPARRLRSDLAVDITLELCGILNERIRDAKNAEKERERDDPERPLQVVSNNSLLWRRVLVRCPGCGGERALASADHSCACGASGLPESWHLIPVAGYRIFEGDTRVRAKHAVLSDMLDFRVKTLPIRPVVLAIVTLIGALAYGLLDYAISGPDAIGQYAIVAGILCGPIAHLLFGARWSGARALLVVRPTSLELVTPEWSREFARTALSTDSPWASIARLRDDTLSIVLTGPARRQLRRALAEATERTD